jgi:hypothetical protein
MDRNLIRFRNQTQTIPPGFPRAPGSTSWTPSATARSTPSPPGGSPRPTSATRPPTTGRSPRTSSPSTRSDGQTPRSSTSRSPPGSGRSAREHSRWSGRRPHGTRPPPRAHARRHRPDGRESSTSRAPSAGDTDLDTALEQARTAAHSIGASPHKSRPLDAPLAKDAGMSGHRHRHVATGVETATQ